MKGKRTTGPERKGNAADTYKQLKNTYRLFDLQRTGMPAAKDAVGLICVCLHKTGSGGCLGLELLPELRDNQTDRNDQC